MAVPQIQSYLAWPYWSKLVPVSYWAATVVNYKATECFRFLSIEVILTFQTLRSAMQHHLLVLQPCWPVGFPAFRTDMLHGGWHLEFQLDTIFCRRFWVGWCPNLTGRTDLGEPVYWLGLWFHILLRLHALQCQMAFAALRSFNSWQLPSSQLPLVLRFELLQWFTWAAWLQRPNCQTCMSD